jgi:OmpR-family two-component system manganese-sensing sensor histidine kinase
MAWVIGLPSWIRDRGSSAPRALERRLLLSYLAAFVVIFLISAVVVRTAFVGIIRQQTIARLHDVARAGMRSVLFRGDTFAIDKGEVANSELLTPDQGLQWFDRLGRQVGTQGLTPQSAVNSNFYSVRAPILNPVTRQAVGTVVASEWNEEERRNVRYLDTGLIVGSLLAVIGSAVGGLALAHRAVGPVERSFQTLREFTDNASHELRGPLTVITASADAALRDAARDPAHDRARFETIADGARQMSRLTRDLLLLAGAERSLERELFAVDLAAAVRKLSSEYAPRFSAAGVALELGAVDPATIYGNPDQIERILANLLDNASLYTPPGGRVRLECRRQGSELIVAVSDTGIGIPAKNTERIFDRFWRADPVRSPQGSGLGLAIARALARRHGGDVTVTSQHGGGSTFVASFPARPRTRLFPARS